MNPPTRGWRRAEGAGMALGGVTVAALASAGWPWWGWLLGALAPELAGMGYLLGKRAGAFSHTLGHLYATPFLVMLLGVALGEVNLIAAAGLWLAHIGTERALGWGLRLPWAFRGTPARPGQV